MGKTKKNSGKVAEVNYAKRGWLWLASIFVILVIYYFFPANNVRLINQLTIAVIIMILMVLLLSFYNFYKAAKKIRSYGILVIIELLLIATLGLTAFFTYIEGYL